MAQKKMKLFDSNIIIYAYDLLEKNKREICYELIKNIFEGKSKGVITNQILGEVFSVLCRDTKLTTSVENAKNIIDSFITSKNWVKINYNQKTIKKAISYVKDYKIHFWDALIAATMIENNISEIYTEDEKSFKKIPGLKVVNPLI